MADIQRICEVVSDALELSDASVLSQETTMEDVSEWDSLAFIKVVMKLESAFNVKIDLTEAMNLTSIRAIDEFLDRHVD